MKRFPRRYAIYLAITIYLIGDLLLGGPLSRRRKAPDLQETGPVAARAYGMELPVSTIAGAVRQDQLNRGVPAGTPASPGLVIRITDRLLAEGIVTTWVKDEGTFLAGHDPIEREDTWVEEKLAPALAVPDSELESFLKENPGVPKAAALQYLSNLRRPSAVRALQRQVLRNAAENIIR